MKRWLAGAWCLVLAVAVAGCKAGPIFQAPGVKPPRQNPAKILVYPAFKLAQNDTLLHGGGGVVVHWGRGEGVFISTLSNFARFFPGRVDMTGYDAAAYILQMDLSASAPLAQGQAHSPQGLGNLPTLRREPDAAGQYLDVTQDLLAAKVKDRGDFEKVVIAQDNPRVGERVFVMAWGDGGLGERQTPGYHESEVLAVTPYGLLVEVPASLSFKGAGGFPLLRSNGELVGLLVRSFEETSAQSQVARYGEATRFVQKAQFIGPEKIRYLLDRVK